MAKIISINKDLIFLDVLPELTPETIEKMRKQRQMFPHTKSQNDENANK